MSQILEECFPPARKAAAVCHRFPAAAHPGAALYCLRTLPADPPTAANDQSERRAAVRSSATVLPSLDVGILAHQLSDFYSCGNLEIELKTVMCGAIG